MDPSIKKCPECEKLQAELESLKAHISVLKNFQPDFNVFIRKALIYDELKFKLKELLDSVNLDVE